MHIMSIFRFGKASNVKAGSENRILKIISCFPLIYFNFKQRVRELEQNQYNKTNKYSRTRTWWHRWHQNISKTATGREHQPDYKLSLWRLCWIRPIRWTMQSQILVSSEKLVTITKPYMAFSPRKKIFCKLFLANSKNEAKLFRKFKTWRAISILCS